MNITSPISRLALLQFLVVVVGVLTTCAMLKFNHYGKDNFYDSNFIIRWNPVAVAIWNLGYLLLAVPAFWAVACVLLEKRAPELWSQTWSIISGFLVTFLLAGLLFWTTVTTLYVFR